ncbi:hypothetical protein [Klebsiella pneumoniae]|uniref:hypothetical protein n=1 Tax=Klebsiella pneumoniae TaxID=573 RepID=UPI0022CDD7E1|nr:hypothetical protein [Klebsiella pneumoniae]
MAGRNHHLNTGSIKPLTYLLSQLRHLLTKLAISAAADRRGPLSAADFAVAAVS